MAKQSAARQKQEQGMLSDIGGGDGSAPEPAAQTMAAPVGWIVYVGGVLWATVLCAAGVAAWIIFAGGGG